MKSSTPGKQPNYGSLIFLHIWRSQDQGTAGCTAIAESTMDSLLPLLDPQKDPVLILLPKDIYKENKKAWGLPNLK